MPSLADLMEDYRNWRGRSEWEQGKAIQDIYGGDPRGQEQFEKFGGFGTDAGGLVGMIKASHGSPHAFTKFLMSKLGTGEGAQAYGHGLYYAEGFDSPVANMYADALGSKNQDLVNSTIDNIVNRHGSDTTKIRAELLAQGLPQERVTPDLESTIAKIVKGTDPSDGTVSSSALREYESLKDLVPNEKHLYNVELRWPDAAREAADPLGEHHLLDWDKPLSEQSKFVQDALAGLEAEGTGFKYGDIVDMLKAAPHLNDPKEYSWAHPKGSDIYNTFGKSMMVGNRSPGQLEASKALRELGIPGIRYLDQGSRGAGQGTHNYVIFDEDIPSIVSRNGVSLSDLLRR